MDWFRYLVAVLIAVGFTVETVKHISTGVAHPMLSVFAFEEVEREQNAAFFWGVVGFNVALGLGLVLLLVVVFA